MQNFFITGCHLNAEYEKRVGAKIRHYREMRGLTQEQVSAQMQTNGCDVTRSALAKIEVGQRHIYVDELRILKKILKVEYDNLLE